MKTKVASERMGVMYDDIIPVLIRGIQEQQQQIEDLKAEVASLKSGTGSQKSGGNISTEKIFGSLEQNIPNPANQTTTIRFSIPTNVANAQLIVTDTKGNTVQQFQIVTGQSQVEVSVLNLAPGTYQYSLYADGQKVATKQMIISK
jgi:hypothetical protein